MKFMKNIEAENLERLNNTLGYDLARFVLKSREKYGELPVVASSEGEIPGPRRVARIMSLLRNDIELSD